MEFLTKPLPEEIRANMVAYIGCIAGADPKKDYLDKIKKAGFKNIKVVSEINAADLFSEVSCGCDLPDEIADSVVSIKVSANK